VPGGGWAAQPGQLASALESCLVIYLKCLPATAARRTEEGEARPLLAGVDPGQRMAALLKEREQFYSLAPQQVDTERADAAAVAASIVDLARTRGGW
jgi:shikimate kinase